VRAVRVTDALDRGNKLSADRWVTHKLRRVPNPAGSVTLPFYIIISLCQEKVRKLEHEAQKLRHEMIQLNAELGERDTTLDDERRARQRAEEKARYIKLFSPPPAVYFLPLISLSPSFSPASVSLSLPLCHLRPSPLSPSRLVLSLCAY
jgi:hypothetical protein